MRILLVAILLSSCATKPKILIPENLEPKLWTATVQVTDDPNLECQKIELRPNNIYYGCTVYKDNKIIMPNPCDYKHEYYAKLFCHEGLHIIYKDFH